MREKLIQGYEKSFGTKPEELYFSPGRVNIIGEHIDYNGGKVLPMGISLGIYGAITWRKDTLCRCVSEGFNNEAIYEFDLNGFKKINDNNGHEIGDVVLKEIANFLISTSSMQEVYYRRSGDEFMILIFEIDISYVFFLINLIERFIESIPQKIHKDIACSAAYGILELKKDNEFGYVVSSKLTDLAMYQAKNSHKLYHYISHQDALNIIKMGNLDERIKEIANKIGR